MDFTVFTQCDAIKQLAGNERMRDDRTKQNNTSLSLTISPSITPSLSLSQGFLFKSQKRITNLKTGRIVSSQMNKRSIKKLSRVAHNPVNIVCIIYLSIFLSIYISIYLSIYLSFYLDRVFRHVLSLYYNIQEIR